MLEQVYQVTHRRPGTRAYANETKSSGVSNNSLNRKLVAILGQVGDRILLLDRAC